MELRGRVNGLLLMCSTFVRTTSVPVPPSLKLLQNSPQNHLFLTFAGVLDSEPMVRQHSRKRKDALLGFVACTWECRTEQQRGL